MFIQPIFLLWLAIVPALMSTAAPLTRRNPEICSGIRTCSDCVVKNGLCSFDLATNQCVSHGKGGSLTNEPKKCQGITAPEEPGQPTASQKAQAAMKFRAISSHVLEGEAKSSSGRHLTSAWLSNHASDAQKLVIDSKTSLASLSTPLKTLWVDNDIPEEASKGKKAPKAKFNGKYTKATVTQICTDAIAWSLFHDANVGKATGPSYSVKSFDGGPNICVTVTTASCYPAYIQEAKQNIGEECH